jgi:hypothetical protein
MTLLMLCIVGCNRSDREASKQLVKPQQKSQQISVDSQQRSQQIYGESRQRALYTEATNLYNKDKIAAAAESFRAAANIDPTNELGRDALSKAMEMDKLEKEIERNAVNSALKEDE